MTSEREIVSSNQKTTGIRGFLTGCFAYADDEVSGKLVFSGVREGFRSGGLEHFRFSPSHGTLYLFVFCANSGRKPLCTFAGIALDPAYTFSR
ncbi:hypothetical protein U8P75_18510 [Rhizobium beringeri]|nr:hypothetical protein U8P75_18510 [Rhizobium beringeri]